MAEFMAKTLKHKPNKRFYRVLYDIQTSSLTDQEGWRSGQGIYNIWRLQFDWSR